MDNVQNCDSYITYPEYLTKSKYEKLRTGNKLL
jgi:hypothetical protein